MPWHRLINSIARPRDDYLPKNEKRVEPSESVCKGGILPPDFVSKVNHIYIRAGVGQIMPTTLPTGHSDFQIFLRPWRERLFYRAGFQLSIIMLDRRHFSRP